MLRFQCNALHFQEQPLLLEDLLEQEKREQEKQLHSQPLTNPSDLPSVSNQPSSSALFTDHEFERIKADVFNSPPLGGMNANPTQAVPGIYSILRI